MSSVAFSNSIAGIDGGSLPPRNIAHVGQMMRDALVAIDARLLARKKEPLMGLNRTGALARNVHRLGAMAIATFKRIVRLHARPFMLGEFEAMAEKLLTRIDRAENLSPHLLRGLHLACNFVGPFVRYMAIGGSARARPIDCYSARLFSTLRRHWFAFHDRRCRRAPCSLAPARY